MTRRPTTFLARDTYRRRRVIDALRVLPALGAILFLVPLLGAATTARSTAYAGMYLFAAWLLLIIGAAALVRSLARAPGGVATDPLEVASDGEE
ncbi:hypothetical protein GQE99_06980 [Maritimibacter sp. DP07]|uniref:Uncharacterized protein n=1 Tax=Maritimibacter harenae TaxID=2606218 RepID=A0A845M0T7_9RHOB|nr:hypothetical protein [Maritimibacter harenae]MZR12762.1 hypothetical protein [Maritimibacter harenae]